MKAQRVAWLAVLALLGCSGSGEVRPRVDYNAGIDAMNAGELEAAYDSLLKARDNAGADAELRFRAAMALGHTKARDADRVEVAEPAKALGFLRESSAWFQDAARLRPGDRDARANLEKVLRRVQILADKLNDEGGGLEAILERVIGDQRSLRDSIRELLTRIETNSGSDPIANRGDFIALATTERKLLADVGTLIDSAGDERDGIEQKPEEERDERESVRLIQLSNAGIYLERARAHQADARRTLRRLSGSEALDDVAAALEELKRAREQLLDPITVLRMIAAEEMQLFGHTRAFAELEAQPAGASTKAPPWLGSERLKSRQEALATRTAELSARLGAATLPDDEELPLEQRRAIEAAISAAPLVERARVAMDETSSALAADDRSRATSRQQDALAALLEAVELFADLRALIDAAHTTQEQTVAILRGAPAAAELAEQERSSLLREAMAANKKRLERLAKLIGDEVTKLEQAAARARGQGQAQQLPPEAAEEIAAEQQRLVTAESLRNQAYQALLEQERGGAGAADAAAQSLEHIEELRRLFFSVVEHLKELRIAQADTHDRTSTADDKSDEEKAPLLGPLADVQAEHLKVGEAIAAALEAQADAASASQAPEAAEQGERLARAADEVRKALIAMDDAAAELARARDDSVTMSVTLKEAIEAQPKAIEHLDEALRILQPPKNQPQDQQEEQDQDKQEQQQDQEQETGEQGQVQPTEADQEISQQEAQRRLEAIREREAQRQKDRKAPTPDAPPEKDW